MFFKSLFNLSLSDFDCSEITVLIPIPNDVNTFKIIKKIMI